MTDDEPAESPTWDAGTGVCDGGLATFADHNPLQRSVLPVFAAIGNRMVGLGTAVCVAPGLFVTARHVAADLDDGLPPEWTVPYDRMWVYLETDLPTASDPDAVYGGLLEVLFANPHTETDLATLTVDMAGNSAQWMKPVTLALRMPDLGEQVRCYGYDLATAEGPLDADDITLVVERRLSVSTGTVTSQQPTRRLGGHHRTSPGFTTTAATPRGMSGGPVFDADNEVVGFNSGSTAPNAHHPRWDSFAAGVAAALELNFGTTTGYAPDPIGHGPDSQAHIADRTIQFAQLVMEDRIACHMYPDFHVDLESGSAGYRSPTQSAAAEERHDDADRTASDGASPGDTGPG